MVIKICVTYFMIFLLMISHGSFLLFAQQEPQGQANQAAVKQQADVDKQKKEPLPSSAPETTVKGAEIKKDLALPSLVMEIKRLESEKPLYSIELRDVQLADFFRVVAHDYNLNIFIDREVSGTVTASFTNVSLEEAIERIAESNDLVLIKKNNIINVVPNLITKTFVLKYLEAAKILGDASSSAGTSASSSSSTAAPAAAAASSSAANTIYDFLSDKGKIFFENAPNSIIVMDYPKNIERISEYLASMDVRPQQVLIEARIVEVQLEKESSLGVNWQAFVKNNGMKIGKYRLYSEAGGPLEQQIGYKSTYYPPGQTSAGAEDPFTITIFNSNINLVVRMLANSLKTNILSAPKVTTINNYKANIKMIQRVPWAEPELETSDQGTVNVSWKINFEEVGINLEVTPTINSDGNITMTLDPDISEQTGEYELAVSQGTTSLPYTVPIIDSRKASTKVIVGNGQTLILGGMIRDKKTTGETKVPFLGDIPFLGYLFKSKKDTIDKTELLIFVSPTIITNEVCENMAKQERYGIGRDYMQERERQEQIFKTMVLQEQYQKQSIDSRRQKHEEKRRLQAKESIQKLKEQLNFLCEDIARKF